MTDYSHLDAILARLGRETARLEAATNDREREFRQLQISQANKELAAEYEFLGIEPMSIDDIAAELEAPEWHDFNNVASPLHY